MKLTRLAAAFIAGCLHLAAVCVPLFAADTDPHYSVKVEHGVAAAMRDGVTLRADVYRPEAEGKFPVLLLRTSYNKAFGADVGWSAASRGYVVVVQDTRGRFTSDGDFYPFRYEAKDGYDTVEWAAALPCSNGKVGMFGASYLGVTQMEAAAAAPPHLAGMFPQVTGSDYHDGWTYQSGAYEQWFNQTWAAGLIQDTLQRRILSRTTTMASLFKLPLNEYPAVELGLPEKFGPAALAPYVTDWLTHQTNDDYWKAISIEQRYSKIRVPAYHIGGLYDIFLRGTLHNFAGIQQLGATEAARKGQRLQLIIAAHNKAGPRVGDLDFGPQATFDELGTMLRWYDYLFKKQQNGMEKEKPVRIFVMGVNRSLDEDSWPPARARETRYFLHSGGKANTLTGSGALSPDSPSNEPSDSFTYNPSDPVRTRGGPLCCVEKLLPGGPFDQREAETRSDVLVYTTPELKSQMTVIGPVSVDLFASSSAVDTDFTAKLVDVHPDGYAQNLADGIIRARFRNSQEQSTLLKPGEVYTFKVDLVATSNVFQAGHRIRLEVSSSNFPRFDRNLNTGEDPSHSARMVEARNVIYHQRARASALTLSVISTPKH